MSDRLKNSIELPSEPSSSSGNKKILWGFLSFVGKKIIIFFLSLIVLSALIYMLISEDGFIKTRAFREEKERLELQIKNLEEENLLLMEKIERLQTDPDYIESEARKKLGLIKPDETVYRLADEDEVF